MKVKPANMLKTIVFKVDSTPEQLAKFGEEWIIAVVRGDHEVNEGKVKALSGCPNISLADPKAATTKGFAIGFVSPRAAVGKPGVLVLVDREAAVGFDDAKGKSTFWATGADKKDYHVKHFNWQRDLGKDPLAAGAGQETPGHASGGLRDLVGLYFLIGEHDDRNSCRLRDGLPRQERIGGLACGLRQSRAQADDRQAHCGAGRRRSAARQPRNPGRNEASRQRAGRRRARWRKPANTDGPDCGPDSLDAPRASAPYAHHSNCLAPRTPSAAHNRPLQKTLRRAVPGSARSRGVGVIALV